MLKTFFSIPRTLQQNKWERVPPQSTGRNDTQHNDIQHNDTRHKGLNAIMLSVVMMCDSMLLVVVTKHCKHILVFK